jgi:hypothetical protein
MIAGHFGLAAGVKGRERQVPLWALMLATVWLDLVFAPLQVKVWFAARYLPQRLQVPAAAASIATGALAIWAAATIQRRSTGER